MDANWRDSEFRCPVCQTLTQSGDWWDDEPENGGTCIGTLKRCLACGWFDRW